MGVATLIRYLPALTETDRDVEKQTSISFIIEMKKLWNMLLKMISQLSIRIVKKSR
jgi:hypothetical protein